MLDITTSFPSNQPVSLLDFGCGSSHLYGYMREQKVKNIRYSGLDIAERFLSLAKKKFPKNRYYHLDILKQPIPHNFPKFDYVVMNGVFTVKANLKHPEMLAHFKKMVKKVFPLCRKGIAFNVMSKHVDWERDDLFHLQFDDCAKFLRKEVSPHFVFRNDYGLYEYTVYVFKKPAR